MNTIRILGHIKPGTERQTAAHLDNQIANIENPTIIYTGSEETAEKLRIFCATRKLAYNHDLDRDLARNTKRQTAAPYLLILGQHTAHTLQILRARSRYPYLIERTAVIAPHETDRPASPKPQCYPTGKKASGSRRSRRSRTA